MKKTFKIPKNVVFSDSCPDSSEALIASMQVAGYEIEEEGDVFVAHVDVRVQTEIVAELIRDEAGKLLLNRTGDGKVRFVIEDLKDAVRTLELLWSEE